MAEPVSWSDDGTPRSERFDDVYRSRAGGLAQSRHVFLAGCGLPGAWADRGHFTILETGFGLGLNFLAAWQAWRAAADEAGRCRILHFVSCEAWPVAAADIVRSARQDADAADLLPLAHALAARWWGLVPGLHRLQFESGRVLLTLAVGDAAQALRELQCQADAVWLDGFRPECNAAMWSAELMGQVARLSRRGARLATWTVAGDVRRQLAQAGFQVQKVPGLVPKRGCLRGLFDPPWTLRREQVRFGPAVPASAGGQALVIGAGLAGAAAAAQLAGRGWQVTVLDAAPQPAAGASALPAGLMAPAQSPDDNLLSQLSRAGMRATLAEVEQRLVEGQDWGALGVLERRERPGEPPHAGHAAAWSQDAAASVKAQAGWPPDLPAWWHAHAAWVVPAALVRAWLAQPGICWRGGLHVTGLARREGGGWRVQCEQLPGRESHALEADAVVVAVAQASAALLAPHARLALHPVRGQVCWGPLAPEAALPFALNGHGHLLTGLPLAGPGAGAWLAGSTYGRGDADGGVRAADRAANLARLRELAPAWAGARPGGVVHDWAGVRCTSTDRRPLAGTVAPGLGVITALGSRGLSLAALCAQVLAAQWHGEPLPIAPRLAQALSPERQR